jgi:hypothetical protein
MVSESNLSKLISLFALRFPAEFAARSLEADLASAESASQLSKVTGSYRSDFRFS